MPDGTAAPDFHAYGGAAPAHLLPLRILATTDLHMHVLPYNYLADRPCDRHGLARTASLVRRMRAEHPNCLLFDNGDVLQGSPMGDYVGEVRGVGAEAAHPAIAAMNALGYDAAALGNHDFNYGLAFLRKSVGQAKFPFLSANLRIFRGTAIRPYTILNSRLKDRLGRCHAVRIGVVGFLPPQTCDWDQDLSAKLACDDILDTANRIVPEMRAAGAELIVALAHSGIGPAKPEAGMENAATALAGIDGIDVVIAGHTHQVFPGPQIAAAPGIDPQRGTLAGKPAVMAGYGGSHLGVIDLELQRDPAGKVRIAAFSVNVEAVDSTLPPDDRVAAPARRAHHATLRHYRRRIGHTALPLNSYFSLIGIDPGLQLVNMAQRWHVQNRLRGTEWEALPVLSAAAPFRAGGRGGPDHYTNVPAGALTLRSLADLYQFPNRVCAVCLDGAQLAAWISRSAGMFRQIAPNSRDAPLIDPAFPCYNFDVVDGVEWEIDLAAPNSPDGTTGRIRNLRRDGRPIHPEDRFILATNTYRFAACGVFGSILAGNRMVLRDNSLTRNVLRNYIRSQKHLEINASGNWHFAPMPGTTVLLETSPEAPRHLNWLNRSSGRRVEFAHMTPEGFAALRLHL